MIIPEPNLPRRRGRVKLPVRLSTDQRYVIDRFRAHVMARTGQSPSVLAVLEHIRPEGQATEEQWYKAIEDLRRRCDEPSLPSA